VVDGGGFTAPLGGPAVFLGPGYLFLLIPAACLAKLTSTSTDVWAGVLSVALFTAAALALWHLATSLLGRKLALVATAAWLVWPTTLGMVGLNSSELPYTLALLLGLDVALRGLDHGDGRRWLVTGALLGMSALLRPAGLPLVASLAFVLVVRRQPKQVVPLCAGAVIVVAPWVAVASHWEGGLVPIATNGPPTFVAGMALDEDVALPPPAERVAADARAAEADLDELAGGAEFLRRQATERPFDLLVFAGMKAARVWYGTESGRAEPLLAIAGAALLVVGAAGLWRWRRGPPALQDAALVFTACLVVTWVVSAAGYALVRYTAPSIALLLLPATGLLTHFERPRPAR